MSTNRELKQEVRHLLRYGKQKSRTGKELASILGFSNDRLVRLAIRDLIAEGLLVISSVHPPYGYYIADNPEEIIEYTNVDANYFNFDVPRALLTLPDNYEGITNEKIIVYLASYYPFKLLEYLENEIIVGLETLNFKIPDDFNDIFREEMAKNNGILSQNSLSKLFGISQPRVSQLIGKKSSDSSSMKLIGALRKEMGERFERFSHSKLDSGYSLVDQNNNNVIIPESEIKEIIEGGGYRRIPDRIVHMKNGDVFIISMKCYDETGSITINTNPVGSKTQISPEINYFMLLNGLDIPDLYQKEFTDAGIPMEKPNSSSKVKLILLIRNISYTNFLTCKIFDQKDMSDIPDRVTFNNGRINKGLLPRLIWRDEKNG